MRHCLNLGRRPDRLVWRDAPLGVDEVRREDGVDERRLAQPGLACVQRGQSRAIHCGEVLDAVPTQMTLNWKPRFSSFRSICDVMLSKPTWLRGKTAAEAALVVAAAIVSPKGCLARFRRCADCSVTWMRPSQERGKSAWSFDSWTPVAIPSLEIKQENSPFGPDQSSVQSRMKGGPESLVRLRLSARHRARQLNCSADLNDG